jgi:hypothetical protein
VANLVRTEILVIKDQQVKEDCLAQLCLFEESQDQDARAALVDLLDLAETLDLLVHREPLEDREMLDQPEILDSWVNPAHQDNPVNLDRPEPQAPPEVLACPESKAQKDYRVHLVQMEASDRRDRLARLATKAILERLAQMVNPAQEDKQVKEDNQDKPAILAVRVHQEKTHNTVLALDAAENKNIFNISLHGFYYVITCSKSPILYFISFLYYFSELFSKYRIPRIFYLFS